MARDQKTNDLPAAVPTDSPLSYRAPGWWSSRLTMLIEGIALATLAFAYFYIRSKSDSWPSANTPLPDLRIPSFNLLVMCVGSSAFWNAARLGRRDGRPRVVGGWLALGVLFGITSIVLRGYDFAALHTRFNHDAYGAITWTILAVHLAHLLAGTIESALTALVLFAEPAERRSHSDVGAMAVYWYFIALSWIPLYAIVFISPRIKLL